MRVFLFFVGAILVAGAIATPMAIDYLVQFGPEWIHTGPVLNFGTMLTMIGGSLVTGLSGFALISYVMDADQWKK